MLANHREARAVLVCGDWLHVLTNAEIAAKKLENFEKYFAIYPEAEYLFHGDSGQGDAIVRVVNVFLILISLP